MQDSYLVKNLSQTESVQLRGIPTSELVRFGHFRVLLKVPMGSCIGLLIGWPGTRWVTDQAQLCRGLIVVGHQTPATRGVTEMLQWCHWCCDWSVCMAAAGAAGGVGMGGSGPNCTGGHVGTYIGCSWNAAGKGV